MKEDAIKEEANNIELEPIISPSSEKQSPRSAEQEEADVHLVRILQTTTEHPVLFPFSESVKSNTQFS